MFRFGGPDNQESVATSIKKLLVAPGTTTRNKKLLGTKGIATRIKKPASFRVQVWWSRPPGASASSPSHRMPCSIAWCDRDAGVHHRVG